MNQPINLYVIELFPSGGLCEEVLTIIRNSLDSGANLRFEVGHEFSGRPLEPLLAQIDSAKPELVVLILNQQQLQRAAELIQAIQSRQYGSEIIVVTETCKAEEIRELIDLGAVDFVLPPINAAAIIPRIWRFLDKAKSRAKSIQSLKARAGIKMLVGTAPSFVAETRKIPLVANCDGRVLILGETGTGKELFARAIHYLSPRMNCPFVPVSCAAIPTELLENELFGHEKGAFTGAPTSQPGLISEAEHGTLFLDEVDSLPPLAQTKLLRFLQEAEYRPLGSTKSRHANVRVIAASNMNPAQAVAEGKLRKDFYYRLNIAQLNLPPLRERRQDIPLLADHFLQKYAREFGRRVNKLSETAMRILVSYDWPGNVRELENTIERAVMFAETEYINDSELSTLEPNWSQQPQSFQEAKTRVIAHFERDYIQALMTTYQGNISRAAQAAKKNRRALWELIRKHRIDAGSYRMAIHSKGEPGHLSAKAR
jgi:DNA-binding NtrC family response regulator